MVFPVTAVYNVFVSLVKSISGMLPYFPLSGKESRYRSLYIENRSEVNYLREKVKRQEKIIKSLKTRLEYEISTNNDNMKYHHELNHLRSKVNADWAILDAEDHDK